MNYNLIWLILQLNQLIELRFPKIYIFKCKGYVSGSDQVIEETEWCAVSVHGGLVLLPSLSAALNERQELIRLLRYDKVIFPVVSFDTRPSYGSYDPGKKFLRTTPMAKMLASIGNAAQVSYSRIIYMPIVVPQFQQQKNLELYPCEIISFKYQVYLINSNFSIISSFYNILLWGIFPREKHQLKIKLQFLILRINFVQTYERLFKIK